MKMNWIAPPLSAETKIEALLPDLPGAFLFFESDAATCGHHY
jgi:hypothetical protein